ncbi:superinfection exclusion B family protein [Shewanella waksmanii]|uniref:superinfection exclusion B family protein n=1 Tax=Shewanella waksmanii TaxID=213783 RepID=UPI00048D8FDD|nr:superinfection exclusion B family protein [Shewanella waksmanii]
MEKVDVKIMKQITPKQVVFNTMLWLALVSATLLFAPSAVMETLRLDVFVQQYAHYLGLGLIIGSAYLLTQVASYFLDEAITYLKSKRNVEVIEKKVRLLDPTERALLREFFLQGETILTLPEAEPAVMSLVETNILQPMGNQRHYAIQGSTADFKISMQARSYLNRQVLRLPMGEPSQEEMQLLIKARPTFANSIVPQRKHAA